MTHRAARHAVRTLGACSIVHVVAGHAHIAALHVATLAADFGREFLVALIVEASKAHVAGLFDIFQ